MKNLNKTMYTEQELLIMAEGAATKWSTAKLSRRYAKQFNRSAAGVYSKIKQIRENKVPIPGKTVVLASSTPAPTEMVQANLNLETPLSRLEIKSVEVFDTYIKLNF
jgi:hypothetical protein